MQAPILLTQSRNLHNDSMWRKKGLEVIPLYKIVVVPTYILNFLTHWHPPPRVVQVQTMEKKWSATYECGITLDLSDLVNPNSRKHSS